MAKRDKDRDSGKSPSTPNQPKPTTNKPVAAKPAPSKPRANTPTRPTVPARNPIIVATPSRPTGREQTDWQSGPLTTHGDSRSLNERVYDKDTSFAREYFKKRPHLPKPAWWNKKTPNPPKPRPEPKPAKPIKPVNPAKPAKPKPTKPKPPKTPTKGLTRPDIPNYVRGPTKPTTPAKPTKPAKPKPPKAPDPVSVKVRRASALTIESPKQAAPKTARSKTSRTTKGSSPKVRDDKKTCKARPRDNRAKKGGGRKRFVLWC